MKKVVQFAVSAASCILPAIGWAYSCPPASTVEGSNRPGIFLGVSYAFESKEGFGVTLGVTSSRRDDRGVVAAGVSYYPTAGSIGVPLGVGYQKSHALVLGGYDFLLKAPVVSGAYTNTSKDKTVADCLPPT